MICIAARRYERLADDPESSPLSWPRSVPELGEPSPSRSAQCSASAIGPPAPTTTGSGQDPAEDDEAADEPSPGTESKAWACLSDSDPIRAKRIPPCASVDVTSAGASSACCFERWATLFDCTSKGTEAYRPLFVSGPSLLSASSTHPLASSWGLRTQTFRPVRESSAAA